MGINLANTKEFYDKLVYLNDQTYVENVIGRNFNEHEIIGKSILDFGCGSGEAAKIFSKLGADGVLGIDIGSSNIEHARRICQDHEKVNFLLGDLNAFDLGKGLYDVIWSDTTLELLEAPLLVTLQNMAAALKPNGKLYLSFTENTISNRVLYCVLKVISRLGLQSLFNKLALILVKLRYVAESEKYDETNLNNKLAYLWIPYVRLISEQDISKALLAAGLKIDYIRQREKSDINSPAHLEVKARKV